MRLILPLALCLDKSASTQKALRMHLKASTACFGVGFEFGTSMSDGHVFPFCLGWEQYVSNVKQPMGLRSCRVLHGIPPSAKRRALAPWTSWHRGCALGGLLWCKQRHTLKCRRNHPRARSPVSVASIVACCLCLGSSSHWVHIWDCNGLRVSTCQQHVRVRICLCLHNMKHESCINTGQMRRTM